MSAVLDAGLVARDPDLPGLGTVLDARAFARALAAALPQAEIRDALPVYVRYKPRTSCLVAFVVRTAAGQHGVYARAHRPDAPEKLGSAERVAGAPSPLGPGGLVLRERALAVHAFPHDRRLKALRALADADRRARLLRRAVPDRPALHRAEVHELRYKPERRWVGMLESAGGQRALLKLHAEPPASPGALGALGTLPHRGLVVLPWVPGRPLDELLSRGHPDLARMARQGGAAVAALHTGITGVAARGGPEREDPGARLRASAEAVAWLVPSEAERAHALAASLANAIAAAPGPAETPVHADCSVDQLVNGPDGEATLIDLDAVRTDDPTIDVGFLLADLEARALCGTLSRAVVEAAATAFLAGYRAAGGPAATNGPGLRRYVAAGLLLRAPEPFRTRHPEWGVRTCAYVRRADALAGAETRANERAAV